MAEPIASELVAPDGTPMPLADADGFSVVQDARRIPDIDGEEIRLTIAFTGEERTERGLRIGLELPVDEASPTWLIPGLVYGENRPVGCQRRFPRYERGVGDPAAMVGDRWSFRADRAATPAVFGWSGDRMAVLAVDQETALGPSGLGFEGSPTRSRVWIDLPYREEPIAYHGADEPDPPDVRTFAWRPGTTLSVTVVAAGGGADRHAYARVLRYLHARTAPQEAVLPWVGVEEAAGLAADGLLAWHYHPEHRALFETASFDRDLDGSPGSADGDRADMHVGWVSGAPWAAQLLAWGRRIGSDAHVRAGLDVLDNIAENLSPSGTFWAAWTLEGGWGTGWSPRGTIHANTIGQATLFYLWALEAEEALGRAHPAWDAAARSNLDAIAARQREDGNLGMYHDAATGEVTEWDGAGALPWIAALVEGADRYDEPRYLDAAQRAGAYYRRLVDDELIYGAPEDVHLAPTSEDGYNAIIAYLALHRSTGDGAWLDLARRAADWALTFRYTYDVTFEPETLLGTYAFRTRGTDQASPANQHLHHFGLLGHPALVELGRAVGDDHYRRRASEALAAWRQFVARRDGDFNARRGMVPERFHQTECFRPKGSLGPLSHAWTCGVLLFACLAALDDPEVGTATGI